MKGRRDGHDARGVPPEGMAPFEAAAWWRVRHDTGDLAGNAELREAFQQWLAGCEARRQAYAQVSAAWEDFETGVDPDELQALRTEARSLLPAGVAEAPRRAEVPHCAQVPACAPRRVRPGLAVAAGLFAAVVGAAALWAWWQLDPAGGQQVAAFNVPRNDAAAAVPADGYASNTAEYVTAPNQSSTVTLPDGTRVSMNLDTAFRVDYDAQQRRVRFSRGQAFFDVAKEAERPFVVTAADQRIQALGTQFDVKLLDPERLEVVLLEGRVSVERARRTLADRLALRTARVELKPDQRVTVRADDVPVVTPTDARRATSWREGWLVFEDETVAQAIGELNRYSPRPLAVADADVGRMRLSGVFRTGQPERFGAIIQELLPVAVRGGAHGEIVLVRRED